LVLAAQKFYSALIRNSIITSGYIGAFLLLKLTGLENNIYAQVAMVMLIGLLGKNAVLIVEFAIQRHAAKSVLEAAMEGAKARFRPILMTSFAFIAGLLPLVFATGPGKINRTIGTAAAGGCLLVPFVVYLFLAYYILVE
jgi:HAE1 family hydrophobic/amphiphilic exporter-1